MKNLHSNAIFLYQDDKLLMNVDVFTKTKNVAVTLLSGKYLDVL